MQNGMKDWKFYERVYDIFLGVLSAFNIHNGVNGGVTSYISHSTTALRVKQPPFSALPGIWLAPFFEQKVYD